MTVLYTPGQMRNAVSIAPETYRHWRKALKPLQKGRGHSPCFSSGDFVAAGVVRVLAVELGIRVGTLAPFADTLFELCNLTSWPVLERSKIVFDVANKLATIRPESAQTLSEKPLIMVPLGPLISQLREKMLEANGVQDQHSLLFLPISVTAPMNAAGGSL